MPLDQPGAVAARITRRRLACSTDAAMPYPDTSTPVHIDAPLAGFSECHHDFVAQLHSALYLPELVTAAAKARVMANDLLTMFRGGR